MKNKVLGLVLNKSLLTLLLLSLVVTGATLTVHATEDEKKTEASEESQDEGDEDSAQEQPEAEEIVYQDIGIGNIEEFLEFARNCKSDEWSVDKRVVLKTDIDLSESDFRMIPYFDGIFMGENHRITGLGNTDDSYITGLFRYVGINGTVQDLIVEGDIAAKDELKFTGGICGMNKGIIKRCTYSGIVGGNYTVGAIAALNENTGIISDCTNEAHVTGYYFTGGIAGKNYGVISGSYNKGNINDSTEWVEKDDAKSEKLLESISGVINEEDTGLLSGTDTGGIAGYSRGRIDRCTNSGNIGYEHTGYNVGGIAGRQMGTISGSTNKGVINGRKDIGGIVGQMEPFLEPEDIQTLPEAADKLHDLVDKTVKDMDGSVDGISSDVTNLTGYADRVVDDGRVLAGELTNSINDNVKVVNSAIERLEYISKALPDVLGHISGSSDKLYYFNNAIARTVEAINVSGEISDDDRDRIESSENEIYERIAEANERTEQMEQISSDIDNIMYEKDSDGEYVYDDNGARQLRELSDEEQMMLTEYMNDLQDITDESGGTISGMYGGVSTILETYKGYTDSAADEAIGEAQNAMSALQDAEGELREATISARGIVDYLNSQEPLRLVGLSSRWDDGLNSLHSNLRGLTGSIESINQDGKSTSHTLNANLEAVNDQVNVIYHIISDRLDIISSDEPELFRDVSDEDIQNAKAGRVFGSKNTGLVKGDINIGGIAGSMAIDEDDPEENAAGNIKINKGSRYTLKNIISSCTNDSGVESKKDGAGLIVGYMAQGIVTNCEGYGLARSTEGGYTGGIAGQSLSIIRDCNSLCILDGTHYVGGICGYGTTVTGCNALVTWEKEPSERYGSIAGIVSTDSETKSANLENISRNVFVENNIGGIDDISFQEKACPVSYAELLEEPGIPNKFRHLKVKFEVDGEILGEQELKYGDSLDELIFPEGKEREGYYVKWPDVTGKKIEGDYILSGEYVATRKAIESSSFYPETEKRIAILGGSYGDDAYINAEIVNEPSYQVSNIFTERGSVIYKVKIDEGTFSQTADKHIRLYNPYRNASVKQYDGKNWKTVPAKEVGSYLDVEMDEHEKVYAVIDTRSVKRLILYAVIVIAGIILAVLLIRLFIKIRKRSKSARSQKVENVKEKFGREKTERKKK